MPRRPRELVDGAIYHVFNRGNDRRILFSDHFHLLLKIQKRGDLAKLMHQVQLAYARYFKKTRAFVGHIFQERFRSPRIYEESYYLQCGRYIERNPVKANLVETAAEYVYSSAPFYVLGTKDSLLTPNPYYTQMGKTEKERRQRYQEFLSLDEPYAQMLDTALVKV